MKKILAKSSAEVPHSKGWSMYIGRWQPWHSGHRWLIDQSLEEGKKVLICIRDVEISESNPWKPEDIFQNLQSIFSEEISNGIIKIMIIPDIESINIGRNVGYDIIEHIPPSNIAEISGTSIRKKMGIGQ